MSLFYLICILIIPICLVSIIALLKHRISALWKIVDRLCSNVEQFKRGNKTLEQNFFDCVQGYESATEEIEHLKQKIAEMTDIITETRNIVNENIDMIEANDKDRKNFTDGILNIFSYSSANRSGDDGER